MGSTMRENGTGMWMDNEREWDLPDDLWRSLPSTYVQDCPRSKGRGWERVRMVIWRTLETSTRHHLIRPVGTDPDAKWSQRESPSLRQPINGLHRGEPLWKGYHVAWRRRAVVVMRGDEFIKGELVEYMAIDDEVENKHLRDVKVCNSLTSRGIMSHLDWSSGLCNTSEWSSACVHWF